MRVAAAISGTICLVGCYQGPLDPLPFEDQGAGHWVEMAGAPALGYHAVWGSNARDVVAVGKGGVAVHDGEEWTLADDVPGTTYRAVWGRSAGEMWVGGDDALLARSLTGWQPQVLRQDGIEIEHYSVLVLAGTPFSEYAIVSTGGKLLLFVNEGGAWETPLWNGSASVRWPFPQQPSLLARPGSLLVAGDSDLVECRMTNALGVPSWESYRWRPGVELPRLSSISGGDWFWAAAGGQYVVVQHEYPDELWIEADDRGAVQPRNAHGIFAISANEMFVVGDPIELATADDVSGVVTSPVEACDADVCVLEKFAPGRERTPLRAVWSDGAGTVIAIGDDAVFERITPSS